MTSPGSASTADRDIDAIEAAGPRKRQKTSSTAEEENSDVATVIAGEGMMGGNGKEKGEDEGEDAVKERAVGVELFVSPHSVGVGSGNELKSRPRPSPLFRGVLKKRYTDFLVNEILPDGRVLRLRELKPRKTQVPGNTRTDRESLPDPVQQLPSEKPPLDDSQNVGGDVGGDAGLERAEQGHIDPKSANGTASASPLSDEVSASDRDLLSSYLGESTTLELISLFHRINNRASTASRPRDRLATVQSTSTLDRATRTKVHEAVRTIFSSRIDSFTDKDGFLSFSATSHAKASSTEDAKGKNERNRQQRPKPSWTERGGEYLHFSIYKENKDTMEVTTYLARQLHINAKAFAFAGTKDKRAVTVQRVSVRKCEAERLAGLNRTLRASAVGDFAYEVQGLSLGDLGGNEFCLTLRDCRFDYTHQSADTTAMSERQKRAQVIVRGAMSNLREMGFLNYYGLQRFGTFAARTDTVGVRLLNGDFRGAVDAILQYSSDALSEPATDDTGSSKDRRISSDDRDRASAISLFRSTGSSRQALEKLPRKFSAESNVIRHLSKTSNDFAGSIQTIPRNLRLMYVHAYQSLVWNNAANARWAAFGPQVVEGDLVLVHEHRDKEEDTTGASTLGSADAEGEPVILPTGDDRAQTADDVFERARQLSASEAASGAYSIFDVVLPLPGYDILYPANDTLKDWYRDFMGNEGLDPYDMRRKQRDFSLSGGYRKLLARIGEGWEADVKVYGENGEDEQFVETDLERIRKEDWEMQGLGRDKAGREAASAKGDKLAVILKFQLGTSQYATMALRELSKGGIVAYKGEYSGGR